MNAAGFPAAQWENTVFEPAPGPTQADVEEVIHRARQRILRYLEQRSVISVVTAPGDGELTGIAYTQHQAAR